MSTDVIDRDVPYRLVSVDERRAGERAFTITFAQNGTYTASFDCAEHFGRYSWDSSLTLEAGATAPRACDEVDLRTGQPRARQESFGAQFLNDQPFVASRRGSEIVLKGRRHSYVLGH